MSYLAIADGDSYTKLAVVKTIVEVGELESLWKSGTLNSAMPSKRVGCICVSKHRQLGPIGAEMEEMAGHAAKTALRDTLFDVDNAVILTYRRHSRA